MINQKTVMILAGIGLLAAMVVGCEEPAPVPVPATPTTTMPAVTGDAPPATPATPASSPAAPTTPAPADASSRPAMTGTVTDAAGKPVAGATVFADATLYYNTNLEARTDKDGHYRIDLPPNGMHTTWRPYGYLTRQYHGKAYRFDLHPEDDAPLAGNASATRNFQWRLSGERPEGRGQYGSHVVAYTELGSDLMPQDVELTLVPDGPLIDGSAGKTIRANLTSTPEGWALSDVPIGRYRITARHVPTDADGAKPAPLLVRSRNKGEYVASITADFESPHGPTLPIHRIDLEVKGQ